LRGKNLRSAHLAKPQSASRDRIGIYLLSVDVSIEGLEAKPGGRKRAGILGLTPSSVIDQAVRAERSDDAAAEP
jgi:hypothetical protein